MRLTDHWEGGGLGEVKVKRSEDQREARTAAGTSADDLEGKKKRERLADRQLCIKTKPR